MARTRSVIVVLPLICILMGLLAAMAGYGHLAERPDEDVAREAESGPVDRDPTTEALTSSEDSFLDDLSRGRSEAKGEGSASVCWIDPSDLPTAAEGALRKYELVHGARLIANGYLDLSGNVWGAVVQGGAAWCDVILVSTEDDETSAVRIARLFREDFG